VRYRRTAVVQKRRRCDARCSVTISHFPSGRGHILYAIADTTPLLARADTHADSHAVVVV
jgi:hypothetical protein